MMVVLNDVVWRWQYHDVYAGSKSGGDVELMIS